MSPLDRRKLLRAGLAVALYAALVVVLGRYLAGTDWAALRSQRVAWAFVALALPISLAVRFVIPRAWALLIRDFHGSVPRWRALNLVHAQSWIARYLPGKIGWVGGRVLFGQRFGLAPGTLAITALVEAVIQMGTSVATAAALLVVSGQRLPEPLLLPALGVALVSVIVLSPSVLRGVLSFVQQRLLRVPTVAVRRLSSGAVVAVATLYVLIHLLGGLPTFLIVKAIHPSLTLGDFPYVIASSLIAGAVGSLAIVAPSGLGVREGFLIVMLGSIVPREVAAVAAIALRLWSIALDLVFLAVSTLLGRERTAT